MWWQNLDPEIYIAVILAGIIITLLFEAISHRLALKKIPIRIHINGTRGKSSVARLIGAGLRAGGLVTCTKTTGTLARFIDPDGNEEAVYRMGHTNVIEQVAVIKKATRFKAQALVIECMALQPLLQSLCELKLVQSTHGVLTNARPDHLDVMGPLEEDVALAMAGTVPVKGLYFTTEQKHLPIFNYAARDRGTQVIAIDPQEVEQVTEHELSQFSYQEHKENIALAIKVCESVGVHREVALQGMYLATPDPGAMSIYIVMHNQQQLIFANAFAANDPVSTSMLWSQLSQQYNDAQKKTLIVNCRKDRHERSAQMGEAVADWTPPDEIMLIGSGTATFTHTCYKKNKTAKKRLRITNAETLSITELLDHLSQDEAVTKHLVVGVGNIANIGLELVDFMQAHHANVENKE